MKLIAWNTTPRCDAAGGDPCHSAAWWWVALAVVGLAGLFRKRKAV